MMHLFELNWPNALFALITVLWILEFRVFPSGEHSDGPGEGSYRLILRAVVITIASSIALTWVGIAGLPGAALAPARIIGISMYVVGIILRYWCSYLLGRYFTRGVTVSEDQRLVGEGPYSVLRHPLYLGLALLVLGVPVFLGSIGGLIVGSVVFLPALHRRISIEEAHLVRTLGHTYSEWMRSRYRLLPYIY